MTIRYILVLLLFLTNTDSFAQSRQIIAGTGRGGYSGDGLDATVAQLKTPSDIFVTQDGSVYIADTGNNRIRRIDPDGTIETIAGNGQRVQSEDGLPATQVGIMSPSSVAVDGSGNVYFAEWTGHRVRVIDRAGIITTIAGNGKSGLGKDGVKATETSLSSPASIFLDGNGRLYIAEWGAHRVRVVGDDGIISTVAGNGEPGFDGDGGPAKEASLNNPNGLFVTSEGDVYFSDLSNDRVRRVRNGIIETIAGNGQGRYEGDGGPATAASLNAPSGLFVTDSGNVYVCDGRNHKIRRIDKNGTMDTAVFGILTHGVDGKEHRKPLRNPSSVFIDANGALHIADATGNTVIRMTGIAEPTDLLVTRPDVVGYSGHKTWWTRWFDW